MTQPRCIDLAARFGRDYRLGHDEAAATWGERRDPWMRTLLCQRGMIYPFGGDRLAVEVDHHPGVARAVGAIPGVVLWQDGDHEKTFLFHVDLFDAVAALVKPRKRRRCHLTTEQLRAGGERLRAKAQSVFGAARAATAPPTDPPAASATEGGR